MVAVQDTGRHSRGEAEPAGLHGWEAVAAGAAVLAPPAAEVREDVVADVREAPVDVPGDADLGDESQGLVDVVQGVLKFSVGSEGIHACVNYIE